MDLSLLLDMAADTSPDREAFVGDGERLTYEALRRRATAGASLILEHPGTTVVYLGVNGVSVPVSLFASALAGRPFAPINYRLSDAELRALLLRTAPSTLIVDNDMRPRLGDIDGVTMITTADFAAATRDPDRQAMSLPQSEPDIAVLLFTSGTTGEPKAAVLRHRHLSAYVISTVEFLSAEDTDAALVSVPPYHIAGISAVLTGVYAGRRTVYLPSFAADLWVETARAERVTHAMVVPTMLGRILALLDDRQETLPYLRALSYGGGRMPQAVIERALEQLPHVGFVNAYGLTETSSTIATLGPDDHRAFVAAGPDGRRRLGSVGRPLPGLEIEIRAPDGSPCAAGVCGEIHVRGEQIAGEYLHKSAIDVEGWFATRDAGWLDSEGYLFVDGRLDDVIVRGGENISPGEIEDVLRAHASVRDVAIVGIPNEQWGEAVAAVIVHEGERPAPADLEAWVRGRLRSTKTPEHWAFRAELPYNETGKLLRRVLRSELLTAAGG